MEWHILVYLSYKKSSNNRKNLQHYSQDVNYYETVKKVHKKVIKNFYHLTTCTLPVYGNQMNRAPLNIFVPWVNFCFTFDIVHKIKTESLADPGFLTESYLIPKCGGANVLFWLTFPQNCIKWKETGSRGAGGGTSLVSPGSANGNIYVF